MHKGKEFGWNENDVLMAINILIGSESRGLTFSKWLSCSLWATYMVNTILGGDMQH